MIPAGFSSGLFSFNKKMKLQLGAARQERLPRRSEVTICSELQEPPRPSAGTQRTDQAIRWNGNVKTAAAAICGTGTASGEGT
ncbi:hypothetical protein ILYODFUR_017060 [Ilyodon furcidens]|uniref:Uncharacterized protein n=1 Tax=Ilyodon furcidens TaxID=33524 RepID=A0ABV0UTV3_9TELE